MPGRYSCPRTCRLCGADYTVLGNASHAGHRMGICGRCATARARDTNDRKASVPDVTMPRLPGALCAGQDPELWQSDDPEAVEYARSECAACPVRDACLAYALAAGITHGMWGGLTERERERLPRGRSA